MVRKSLRENALMAVSGGFWGKKGDYGGFCDTSGDLDMETIGASSPLHDSAHSGGSWGVF